MNEQLEQYLVRTLGGLEQGLSSSMDLLASEIPLYIQELLIWHAMKSVIMTLIGSLLIGVTVVKGLGLIKDLKTNNIDYLKLNPAGTGEQIIVIVPVSLMLIGIGLMMISFDWLQILVAPRVWLLEYAASLIK